MADFARAVRDRRPPAIPAASALPVHRVIDAIAASSRCGTGRRHRSKGRRHHDQDDSDRPCRRRCWPAHRRHGQAQELRGWNTHVPDYPVSIALDRFVELVEERTDGRIQMQNYHGATLGEGEFATEQLQFGALDYGVFSTAPMVNTVKELGVASLPYVFKDPEHQYRVMEGPIGEDIAAAMAEANMVPLSWFASGVAQLLRQCAAEFGGRHRGQEVPRPELRHQRRHGRGPGRQRHAPALRRGLYLDPVGRGGRGREQLAVSYEIDRPFRGRALLHHRQPHDRPRGHHLRQDRPGTGSSEEDQAIVREAAQEAAIYQRELWAEREKKSREIVEAGGRHHRGGRRHLDLLGQDGARSTSEFASDPVVADLLRRIQETD